MLYPLDINVLPTPPAEDLVGTLGQFTEAIVNYRVVGLTGLMAVAIGVLISVLKRWGQNKSPAPNWWKRLPRWGRRLVVAGLGVVFGVLSMVQGGVNPGEAMVLGLAGLVSVSGHELGRRFGLIPVNGHKRADGDPS